MGMQNARGEVKLEKVIFSRVQIHAGFATRNQVTGGDFYHQLEQH